MASEVCFMKQKVSIYDLAEKSGLSPSTISRVLNHPEQVKESTRHKVYQLISDTDFSKRRYAEKEERAIQKKASRQVPLRNTYLALLPTAANPFYGEVIEGIQSAAMNSGCHVLVDYYRLAEDDADIYANTLASAGFEGAVILGSLSPAIAAALTKTIPIIQCSEYNETIPDISSVSVDDEKAEYHAAAYAFSKGYRRPLFFSCSYTFHFAVRRFNGFRQALEEAGIPYEDNMSVQIPQFSFELAHDTATRILSGGRRPDIIFCISDIYAAACIKTAIELNIRIPEELGIIGFDDTSVAETTTPGITTIRQHRFQLGYSAFEILHSEVRDGQEQPQHLQLATELIIRESTR